MKCDSDCPCPLGETCLGRRFPEWAEIMRGHWESGDSIRREFVRHRSALPYQPDPVTPVNISESQPVVLPRLRDMAASLAGTVIQEAKHIITGHNALVGEDIFTTRVAICRGDQGDQERCRFLQEIPRLRCLKCGCHGEIAFRMPVKACPIGRWPAQT